MTLRVVLIAVTLGGAAMLVWVLTQKPINWDPNSAPSGMETFAMIGSAAVAAVAYWIVPAWLVTASLGPYVRGEVPSEKMSDPSAWLSIYVTQAIVGFALLEGAILSLALAFFFDGSPYLLAGGMIFLVFLALQFPTRDKVNRWLASQPQ
jgi:hypothetical protein